MRDAAVMVAFGVSEQIVLREKRRPCSAIGGNYITGVVSIRGPGQSANFSSEVACSEVSPLDNRFL